MKTFIVLGSALLMVACGGSSTNSGGKVPESDSLVGAETMVLRSADVQWEMLNPARGDKSPQAATLWGDRKGEVPTGFLVKFVDGFSSPPHIHNVSYRGVVISGQIHNDDPDAAEMWMPAGSYWTQPKGEAHITAAKGSTNVAYIEIDQGPYLVKPIDESFDSGERPVNVDASNLVWLEPMDSKVGDAGVRVTYLWGDPVSEQPSGRLFKLPPGFEGTVRGLGDSMRAVVIKGTLQYEQSNTSDPTFLEAGSFLGSDDPFAHRVSCISEEECLLYVRSSGSAEIAI